MANTPKGKNISSQNAQTHGLCSEKVIILPCESEAEYDALGETWFKAYNPKEEVEFALLHRIIDAEWLLTRANRTLAEIEAELYHTAPLDWSYTMHQTLTRFTRYQTARANTAAKARKALEDYRKSRLSERASTNRTIVSDIRRKHKQREDNPGAFWAEHLAKMKQQAIDLGFRPPDPDTIPDPNSIPDPDPDPDDQR